MNSFNSLSQPEHEVAEFQTLAHNVALCSNILGGVSWLQNAEGFVLEHAMLSRRRRRPEIWETLIWSPVAEAGLLLRLLFWVTKENSLSVFFRLEDLPKSIDLDC